MRGFFVKLILSAILNWGSSIVPEIMHHKRYRNEKQNEQDDTDKRVYANHDAESAKQEHQSCQSLCNCWEKELLRFGVLRHHSKSDEVMNSTIDEKSSEI